MYPMIYFITKETLTRYPHVFDQLRPSLGRALGKTSLSDDWSLDALRDAILNGQAHAFHQSESGYTGAFTINTSPLRSNLYFFWSGKDSENERPVNYSEVDEYLVKFARLFGCSSILCEGRKGWKSVLPALGYKEDSVTYIKEVRYEPSTIQPIAETGCLSPDGR